MFEKVMNLLVIPERTPVQAGPIRLFFESGDLRYLRWENREVIRRIYAAVRDKNWNTIPGVISKLTIQSTDDEFQIGFQCEHRQNEIHFLWDGTIHGTQDGTIRFDFDGTALSTFLRNRIGFCVLHPLSVAGDPCHVTRLDNSTHPLVFPKWVEAKQPVPGFFDMKQISHHLPQGGDVELKMEGDHFEMEDQRNWIDASFKTFCTPLRLPFPVEIQAGTRIQQSITVRIREIESRQSSGTTPIANINPRPPYRIGSNKPQSTPPVEITVTKDRQRFPQIGLGIASHSEPLSENELRLLSRLGLWHLRVDLKLDQPGWENRFVRAAEQTNELVTALELAIHLPKQSGSTELVILGQLLRQSKADVSRVLVYRNGEKTTDPSALDLVQTHLRFLEVPIGVGTDADFYQLNQFRPIHNSADFVHWSMNPQVHAFDLASLIETPTAIPAQIESARRFFDDKPMVVSPVTLKPRFNPVATSTDDSMDPSTLPASVDPRILTPFAACWTFSVIKALAESGVESMTLFETTGSCGILERATGSPWPDLFPSTPGQVFPPYLVLAAVQGFGGGEAIATRSSDPLVVQSFMLLRKSQVALWIVNMTANRQSAWVKIPSGIQAHLAWDWSRSEDWMKCPDIFRHENAVPVQGSIPHAVEVQLEPYGIECLVCRFDPHLF